MRYSVRVKIDQIGRRVAVIRFHWEGERMVAKDSLNEVGEWIPVAEGGLYLWDAITDIHLKAPGLGDGENAGIAGR